MSALTRSPAWQALQGHYEQMANVQMRELFAGDAQRFERFSLRCNDILLDYSKNRVRDETLQLLRALAEQAELPRWIEAMFRGEKINHTEDRAVLHVALRNLSGEPVLVDGEDVMPQVQAEQDKMAALCEAVRSGQWRGASGARITDIVNIGIGGSDLGPEMVCEALRPWASPELRVHFVSNVDANMILDTLAGLEPASTLFIVASKTFTTQETMTNARTARRWVLEAIGDERELHRHFVAVSANIEAAREFGIAAENIFAMWDWVGGRYSLWSTIGLPIALYIGMDQFRELLCGAYDMDRHFRSTPLAQNLPVTLALLGIWYNNFFGCETHAVLPYAQHLRRLPAYLQQADMESNGKSVDRAGQPVDYETGPVLFGEIGINAQHAFYQLLHQGTKLVPADMLAEINPRQSLPEHHRILLSNIFAQAEALMTGKTGAEARAELEQAGLSGEALERLLPYKVFPGNRPTNTILFGTLDPKTLGSLIAMYEHKIFVQGVIWNINSFDQWGVELGKQLASRIQPELEDDQPVRSHDSSTNGLINYYKQLRRE